MRSSTSVAIVVAVVVAGCSAAVGSSSTPSPSVGPTPVASRADRASSAGATPVPNRRDGVASDEGLFIGSWSSEAGGPPINIIHEWVLHIETADGRPVVGAIVNVNGDMPAHGHGMPTQPRVTADLGSGNYRVEGMSFQMGGYWIIDVIVVASGQTDRIRFGLDL